MTPTTNNNMSEDRRNRLLALQKREELKDVVLEKLKERFPSRRPGAAGADAAPTRTIRAEVDRFISRAKLTEANLARLERRVGKKMEAGQEDRSEASSQVSGVSAYSLAPSRLSAMSNYSTSALDKKRRPSATASAAGAAATGASRIPDDYSWTRLDDYAQYLHKQDVETNRTRAAVAREQLRGDLDRQVMHRRLAQQQQREDQKKFFVNQVIEAEAWKNQEAEKAAERKRKALQERDDRGAQLQFENKLRARDQAQRETEEARLVQQVQLELEEGRAKELRLKRKQKESMMRVYSENVKEREEKEQQKAEQAAADVATIKEYNRILDEQEQQRAVELQERVDRQKTLLDAMKASVLERQQERGNEDASRAREQQDEADSRALEMQENKERRLREIRHETQDFLRMQMREKADKKKQALQLKKLQTSVLEADTAEFSAAEADRKVAKFEKNKQHRGLLEDQIYEKTLRQEAQMSVQERLINSQLIHLVDRTLEERDVEAAARAATAQVVEEED